MNDIVLLSIHKEDLSILISQAVKAGIEKALPKTEAKKELVKSKVLAERLGVSIVTIFNWEKKGILKKYRIGGQVRYRMDEVLSALKEIESK